MIVEVNGDPREVEAGAELVAVVADLGLPAATVLIEHNGEALRREEWAGRLLSEGDRLEIIRIVAGG